jgi:hypothetical protein
MDVVAIRYSRGKHFRPCPCPEGVKLAAIYLQQSEGRLYTSYRAFDEALRAFEARLPQDAIARCCSVIPPEGIGGIKAFEGKSEKETAEETAGTSRRREASCRVTVIHRA